MRLQRICVLGAPSALGQPHRGVSLGPEALRHAGLIKKLKQLGHEINDCGNLPHEEQAIKATPPDGVNLKNLDAIVSSSERLFDYLQKITAGQNTLPLILGGDHSISIGSIAAMAQQHDNLGVIWYDAHPDLNTPQTSPSGNIHGMSLAICLGIGHPHLVGIGGSSPKVKPEHVVIIGARSIDGGEEKLIKDKGIKLFTMADVRKLGMEKVMEQTIEYLAKRTGGIHLSLDLDGIDPVVAPGVGTPVPGGILFHESTIAMELLNHAGLVTSVDIVELNPAFDQDNRTANTAVALVSLLLRGDQKVQDLHA